MTTDSIQRAGVFAQASTQAAAAPAAARNSAADTSERFLKMLVAQLKNQDPLNPLDNAQVTSQMAQISTVEGISRLNATLAGMSASSGAAQSLQAANLVGRQVMTGGSTLMLADGVARGGYQLEGGADAVTLTVRSASGVVVHRAELGAQNAGLHAFQWDGMSDAGVPAAGGAYSFEISARSGGRDVAASALMLGRVDAVSPEAGGAKLTLGGLGTVGLADIKHIF